MSAVYYDITTAGQLAVLNYLITQIDIYLGYLAVDGVTATPKPGRDGWQVGGVNPLVALPLGETLHWTQLRPHPTQSGRYALLVDIWVSTVFTNVQANLQALVNAGTATAGQTTLLNGMENLPAPVQLDSSWQT